MNRFLTLCERFSCDGLFLKNSIDSDHEIYVLLEDIKCLIKQNSTKNIKLEVLLSEIKEFSNSAWHFVRHYSVYDKFVSMSDVKEFLEEVKEDE